MRKQSPITKTCIRKEAMTTQSKLRELEDEYKSLFIFKHNHLEINLDRDYIFNKKMIASQFKANVFERRSLFRSAQSLINT